MISYSRLRQTWFTPLLAGLLKDRPLSWVLLGTGALQLGLSLFGLPAWVCPIKAALGIPCPGCGLTSAMVELLRGDWRQALATHAFAPIFLLAGAVLLVGLLLPEAQRKSTISAISAFESRTGISTLVLISLMVYWWFRLFGLN